MQKLGKEASQNYVHLYSLRKNPYWVSFSDLQTEGKGGIILPL